MKGTGVRSVGLALGLVLLASSVWGQGKPSRVLTTDKPLVITVEVGKATSVVLPEPIVFIGAIERPDLYSYNYHGPYFYMYPLNPALDVQVFIVGQSGEQHILHFKTGTSSDLEVRIVPPRPKAPQVQPVTVATWFRALDQGLVLPGQVFSDTPAPDTRQETRVQVQRLSAVAHGTTVGMVLLVQNISETALTLDLSLLRLDRAWAWPPRHDVTLAFEPNAPSTLEPGQSQRLYAVLERRGN